MDATGHQSGGGIIYEPVSCDAAKAVEAGADDLYRKVTAFPRAGMASVQVAVVAHKELLGL